MNSPRLIDLLCRIYRTAFLTLHARRLNRVVIARRPPLYHPRSSVNDSRAFGNLYLQRLACLRRRYRSCLWPREIAREKGSEKGSGGNERQSARVGVFRNEKTARFIKKKRENKFVSVKVLEGRWRERAALALADPNISFQKVVSVALKPQKHICKLSLMTKARLYVPLIYRHDFSHFAKKKRVHAEVYSGKVSKFGLHLSFSKWASDCQSVFKLS